MPVNPISIAVAWFATHLVIFSLLGFVLAGLFVFGVIDMPGTASATRSETLSATARPGREVGALSPGGLPEATEIGPGQVVSEKPGQVRSALERTGEGDDDVWPRESVRPAPRLIGGSLPIYGRPGVADGSFRPPGDVSGPVDMTREEYLQQARRAFWNGEFEAAESAYMALISRHPGDADAFGELGNLYQSMGKPDRALDAYFEAAVRLKAAGNSEKLNEIIGVLRREGDERADRLVP